MDKLKNWNAWCNDKILLHSSEHGLPVLLSPNAILGMEEMPDATQIALVDGLFFEVKEKAEEILEIISSLIVESEARKAAKEAEERKKYEEMMAAQKAEQEASEGK